MRHPVVCTVKCYFKSRLFLYDANCNLTTFMFVMRDELNHLSASRCDAISEFILGGLGLGAIFFWESKST